MSAIWLKHDLTTAELGDSSDIAVAFDTGEQIYDLRGDPGQRSALADAAAPGLARLRAALADTDAPARADVDEILDRRGEITEEFAEQLRALGYIE